MIKTIKHDIAFEQLLKLGDIHGEFGIVKNHIKNYDLYNSAIFQVGDFGLGFNPKMEAHNLKILNQFLKTRNCYLYAIRGNHDDPAFFNNEFMFSNIFLVDDWTILELNVDDKIESIFCFGGALSIDRMQRKAYNSGWWPDEVPKFNVDLSPMVKNITQIVSHTAPEWTEPYFFNKIVYDFAVGDPTLLEELTKERREMTYMFDIIYENNIDTLAEHYYGHFHFAHVGEYKGVKLRLLNVNELC